MIAYPNPKLNIGLDVLRRREDGYHDLESLFVPYDGPEGDAWQGIPGPMKDVLGIEEAGKFSVEIIKDGRRMDGTVPGEWDPMKDLVVKAYKLLKADFDLPPVRIHLEKNIPVGAGLGGGSADGAFTLRMVDEIFDLYLPYVVLEDYAAQLGSDCPFFIYNRPMFVSGRGDVLDPFDVPELTPDRDSVCTGPDYRIEIAAPSISVSTKEAYAGIIPARPEVPLRELLALPVVQWREAGVKNDFEKTVFAIHPELAVVKQNLYDRGAVYASMSGSGSAIFGIFPNGSTETLSR